MLFYLPFLLFLFYGQRIQAFMILGEVSRALGKLKIMREKSRKEVIDYLVNHLKPKSDPQEQVDQLLEYFTIMPVDLDPSGIVRKIEHVVTVRNDRIRSEIRRLAPETDLVKVSTAENILEAASSINYIYKLVRHFYLLGKRTSNIYILVQLQMIMPMILQEADALVNALEAFKLSQPIGDGIGPMVVGRMMLNHEKMDISKDTVMVKSEYKDRNLYLIKAVGPGGNVGEPGTAVERLISELGVKINSIIMIDAALKLEGEKTGEVAEGVGAAIGGIGVDRFKIEEVATKMNIPLYAVVIKQSLIDAISVMRKEIAEAAEKVTKIVYRLVEEKTQPNDNVLIVGVGNTLGVAQ
ncbi:MAG: DUF1512 domain-containing protein [Nitrososphaerales archaeon]